MNQKVLLTPICLATTQNRNKNSRSAALEFQDFPGFSMVFQDLWLFPALSRPGILNNKIPRLSRVCTNPGIHFGPSVRGLKHLLKDTAFCCSTAVLTVPVYRAMVKLSLSRQLADHVINPRGQQAESALQCACVGSVSPV